MNFYYALDGKPLGPVSRESLSALRAQATIDDVTLVVGEGESHWVAYGERLGSTPAVDAPAPTVPAPVPAFKERISAAAYQRAIAATTANDEFNTSNAIEFPALRYNFPAGDSGSPKLCIESFIALPGHSRVTLQLVIWYRHDQSLVNFNTVKVSGGLVLESSQLNSNLVRYESAPSEWRETINIFIPIELLLKSFTERLRLQISRPNEGKSFIINISADSVAAVLFRLFPDRYEVDSADLSAQEKKKSRSKAASVGWIMGLATMVLLSVFTPLGFVTAFVCGTAAGSAYYWSRMLTD